MKFENRRYLILERAVLEQADFNQVEESSIDTCRFSLDGTKGVVKYEVTVIEEDISEDYVHAETEEVVTHVTPAGVYGRPSFYEEGMVEHTHEEILTILVGPEWTEEVEEE